MHPKSSLDNVVFSSVGKRGYLITLDLMYTFRNNLEPCQAIKFLLELLSTSGFLMDLYGISELLYMTSLRVLYDLINRSLCQQNNGKSNVHVHFVNHKTVLIILQFLTTVPIKLPTEQGFGIERLNAILD